MCPVWHSSPMRWYSLPACWHSFPACWASFPACWHSFPACWHSFGFGLDVDRIWFLSAAPKQAPQQGLVRRRTTPKPGASHHQTRCENPFNPNAKTFRTWFHLASHLFSGGSHLVSRGFAPGFGRLAPGFAFGFQASRLVSHLVCMSHLDFLGFAPGLELQFQVRSYQKLGPKP